MSAEQREGLRQLARALEALANRADKDNRITSARRIARTLDRLADEDNGGKAVLCEFAGARWIARLCLPGRRAGPAGQGSA